MTVGYEWSSTAQPFLIASPEKALLDVLYISTRKGRRFSALPEIDWSQIKLTQLKKMTKDLIKYPSIRTSIENKINNLISK